jgi:hypothetical protein
MRLSPRLVPGWPKLAWVATFARGDESIEVLHGPMVETAEDWCVGAPALDSRYWPSQADPIRAHLKA